MNQSLTSIFLQCYFCGHCFSLAFEGRSHIKTSYKEKQIVIRQILAKLDFDCFPFSLLSICSPFTFHFFPLHFPITFLLLSLLLYVPFSFFYFPFPFPLLSFHFPFACPLLSFIFFTFSIPCAFASLSLYFPLLSLYVPFSSTFPLLSLYFGFHAFTCPLLSLYSPFTFQNPSNIQLNSEEPLHMWGSNQMIFDDFALLFTFDIARLCVMLYFV